MMDTSITSKLEVRGQPNSIIDTTAFLAKEATTESSWWSIMMHHVFLLDTDIDTSLAELFHAPSCLLSSVQWSDGIGCITHHWETIFTGNCFDSTCFRVRRACHSYVWKALELRASMGWKISASRSFKPRQVWNTPTCVSFWIWKASVEIFAFQPPFSVDAMFQVVSALVDSCWKPKKRKKKTGQKPGHHFWETRTGFLQENTGFKHG